MWTSDIKIWIKTETEWREAVAFVKDATGWKPTTGFIKTGNYEQVPIVSLSGLTSLPSVRGLNEVSIQSLDFVKPITTSPLFVPTTIQSLASLKPILTSPLFREVAIFLLPQTISVPPNNKPW